jgi:hypothetical protein
MSAPTSAEVLVRLREVQPPTFDALNVFCRETLVARGGRMGSGLGTLLEALWGFHANRQLTDEGIPAELAWLVDNEYNDFACVDSSSHWDSTTREGEFFRVEAKSMNIDAEESKGHFDELVDEIGPLDQLLVILWRWVAVDDWRVVPDVHSWFFGNARDVAVLRDRLHVARGGTFVLRDNCPDSCDPPMCTHHGEPLNANGVRERRTGPVNTRGKKASYAANFGGLVRMLKVRGSDAKRALADEIEGNAVAAAYLNFIADSAKAGEAIRGELVDEMPDETPG